MVGGPTTFRTKRDVEAYLSTVRADMERGIWIDPTPAGSACGVRHAVVGAKELMARFGQSTSRAALIYQHATKDRDHEIADALSAMIESKLAHDLKTSERCHDVG